MWTATLLLALTPTAPAFDDWDGLHSALATLGDLDGDGLEELVIQTPVLQEVRVLGGADLAILWTLDVTSLPRP